MGIVGRAIIPTEVKVLPVLKSDLPSRGITALAGRDL
jgi:hypothetical protein